MTIPKEQKLRLLDSVIAAQEKQLAQSQTTAKKSRELER